MATHMKTNTKIFIKSLSKKDFITILLSFIFILSLYKQHITGSVYTTGKTSVPMTQFFYFINDGATEGAYSPTLGRNQCVIVPGGYGLFDTGMLKYSLIRVFLIPYGPCHVQHNVFPEPAVKLLHNQLNMMGRGKLMGPGICGHPICGKKHGNVFGQNP